MWIACSLQGYHEVPEGFKKLGQVANPRLKDSKIFRKSFELKQSDENPVLIRADFDWDQPLAPKKSVSTSYPTNNSTLRISLEHGSPIETDNP